MIIETQSDLDKVANFYNKTKNPKYLAIWNLGVKKLAARIPASKYKLRKADWSLYRSK
jgi:hypothetical protein